MRALTIGIFLILVGCAPTTELLKTSNPFPRAETMDVALASSFQSLALDERLFAYKLIEVRKGNLAAGQTYEIPFNAPQGRRVIVVTACGQGCTSARQNLLVDGLESAGNTTYGDEKTYTALNVGTSDVRLMSEIRLENCQMSTCGTFWALYAR